MFLPLRFPRAACRGEGNVFQWLMRAISLSGRSEKQCLSDILTHLCENERWYLNNLHLFPNRSDTKTCDFQLISFYIGIWHCNMSLYPLPAVLILMMAGRQRQYVKSYFFSERLLGHTFLASEVGFAILIIYDWSWLVYSIRYQWSRGCAFTHVYNLIGRMLCGKKWLLSKILIPTV